MNKVLIVGLGNIGAEYNFTRHNIGFDIADVLVAKHGGSFALKKLAHVAEIKIKNKILVVIKPTTYMNLSGDAMRYYMQQENIAIDNTLTLVDDLALPLDTIRLKGSGSDAGHNGLKHIHSTLGTVAYPKLRFGIGNNFGQGQQVKFVLGQWLPTELEQVKRKILLSVDATETFALSGLQQAMAKYNNSKTE